MRPRADFAQIGELSQRNKVSTHALSPLAEDVANQMPTRYPRQKLTFRSRLAASMRAQVIGTKGSPLSRETQTAWARMEADPI